MPHFRLIIRRSFAMWRFAAALPFTIRAFRPLAFDMTRRFERARVDFGPDA